MKMKFQKICIAAVAIVMFTGIMLLSIEKNDRGRWEFATISSLAQGGENGGGEDDGGGEQGGEDDEDDEPGNWAAVYPPCEYTVSIGVPPLVINKTYRGTYRDCVQGSGICLVNDNACCANRVGGVCIDIL